MAGPNAIVLSNEADVILLIRSHSTQDDMSFCVSTGMLKPASKVFRVLLDGDFAEGKMSDNAPCPRIILEEDDADAMAVILRILHHDHQSLPKALDLRRISSLAIHCDKFDCAGILRPWLLDWLARTPPVGDRPTDVGLLILTTYFLRASPQFSAATSQACKVLNPTFRRHWVSDDMVQRLPENIMGKMGTCLIAMVVAANPY